MLRILCVDDHQVVRDGVRRIFDDKNIPVEIGEASDAAQATWLANRQEWDIAVLDISLGGKTGLDVLKEIKQLRPRLPVLMFSMHSEEVYARRAINAGAQGYITKGSSSEELFAAINRIASGGRYITPALAEKIVFTANAERLPHETLSNREYEVMLLIARGKSNKEISEALGIDSRTVTTHRRRLLDKMNLNADSELNEYARVNRLLE
jgi:two-component system, NarL family, invasion response regulator UvrY